MHECEALIFRSGIQISAELMELAPNLKLLVRAGSGVDNIDLPYVRERGLELVRIPEPGAQAVAELSFAFMLGLSRNLFAADPERYAPKYGGYWAASLASTGKVVGVNPEAFKIIDGKLYLNWSLEVSNKFAKNADESIKNADENWAKLNTEN